MDCIGIDLHKKFLQVARLSSEGELKEVRLTTVRTEVRGYFKRLARSRVAIEATGSWWWLVDILEDLGHEVFLSHPKQTKAIASARVKNDRVDAKTLAYLLQADLLPKVWIPPRDLRRSREPLRQRIRLGRMGTNLCNRIQAFTGRRNLTSQRARNWLSQAGRQELSTLDLSEDERLVLQNDLEVLTYLEQKKAELDQQLWARLGEDPRVQRLMTIPGVGPLVAIGLVVEIGDIYRFRTARQLANYLGLAPRTRESGGYRRAGRISKEGNRNLRWLLSMAVQHLARADCSLADWHRNLRRRKKPKVARIALTRKLVGVVFHIWQDEIDWLEFQRRGGCGGELGLYMVPTGG
jgi:transposase